MRRNPVSSKILIQGGTAWGHASPPREVHHRGLRGPSADVAVQGMISSSYTLIQSSLELL